MTEHERQQVLNQMREEETLAQINAILRPLPPRGDCIWSKRGIGEWMESMHRLNIVLSGKEEPFSGAAEYLQKIRSGSA